MSQYLKRFTESGIIQFATLIEKFRVEKSINEILLNDLLNNREFTEDIDGGLAIDIPKTNNKYEIAKYLSVLLELKTNRQLYRDSGLWTWLSAFMLDLLVPYKKNSTSRDFKENALYVLESNNYKRYYRHLLAFAALTYTEMEEKGRIFLRGEIYERGEIVEQLASVYNIQRNYSIIEAATILFYNKESDSINKGAADKFKGGSARRFREVLKQFQLTFDLNSMNGSQVVKILPTEFNKWKKAS